MVLDFDIAQKAPDALEDAEDAAAADEAAAALARGEETTIPLDEVARELGLTLD